MSDDEQQHVSNEELDAERDMEREAEAAEAAKHEEAEAEDEAEDEGDEKQQQQRDDSDDDSEKSDEAMEDNEEPEIDGDSKEPSDGESIDGESDEEESETEHEKRIRKTAALQFLDLEADEGTEKKIFKHLKKKIAAEEEEENKYEMDSIMDAEDEITYDTDYELERKSKKKKGEKKPAVAAAAEKKKKQTKKRKRIRSPLCSEDEKSSSDSDNDREEKRNKMTTRDVSDDEMQHMQTLGGTSKAHKVAGQAARPKAAFHEHSDIAKAAAEKKQMKVSPSSLIDSPKLKPKAKSDSTSKSPAKKPRTKKVPTLEVGEQFELKERGAHKVYRISFRGEDAPLVIGPTSNKKELKPEVFHPKYFCTAQMLEETEAGDYKELNKFELFFVSPGRAPKKVGVQWATSGWNTFNLMGTQERYEYVISALNHNNIVPGVDTKGRATKRMMFTEPLLQQIKSEAVLNPNGEWKWMPKHMELPDLITPRDENGEPTTKAMTGGAAAAAAAAAKKKATVQAKPKIDRIKETNSHNVSTMLHKKAAEQTAAMANSSNGKNHLTIDSKAIQKHAKSSSSSCSVSSNAALDFFSASPEPTASEPAMLFGTESTRESTKELLSELIDLRHRRLVKMGHKENAGDEIEKSFTFLDVELTKVMESNDDFETKCKEFDEATKKIKGLQLLLIALPFFNVEAAQMMREKLAQM